MIDSLESLIQYRVVSILKKDDQIIQSQPVLASSLLELLLKNETPVWAVETTLTNSDGSEWLIYHNNSEFIALKAEFQEFVYTVSHDLKAPLRNVSKFAEVLLKKTEQFEERTLKSLEFIQSGVDLMKGQLDGILEYSRVETQGESFAATNLAELFDQFKSNNSAKIEMISAIIELNGLDFDIYGDKKQLYQLITKLLDNSFVHNLERPMIRVEGFNTGGFHGFSMTDNGLGIPEERIDNLFKIFGKFHRDINHNGLGLGLTIAKRIVQRHGGFINIENKDQGVQITVGFPLAS